jgi:hypothetical protein
MSWQSFAFPMIELCLRCGQDYLQLVCFCV